nr:3-dehydroshikimate dehydratase [Quercus suber]
MPCRPAICSHSLGRAWVHNLPHKITQAARCGLDLELFWEDVEYFAKEISGEVNPSSLKAACHLIHQKCSELGVAIVCLQPFMHYEGLRDRAEHARRIEEMTLWISLTQILDTKIIAIPSTSLGTDVMTGDLDVIVSDLQEVADLGAPHGIQFAYESLCWGTYSDTWEQSWEVVKRVDRANFGICLDTFNIAGRVYADPTSPTGKVADADAIMTASIARMVAEIDVKKIVFVQVVDAERLAAPLVEGHEFYDAAQPARMSWSRNCRLFYGEVNFGICLDTFNIAGRVYADPTSPTGKVADADAIMTASIARMVAEIDVKKIVFVQVVDAERLAAPLVEGHEFYDAAQPARMSWSRNCRLFYGEEARGAYLPVKEILRAVLVDLGFEGWVSAELFNRSLVEPSPFTPEDHARRAAVAWQKIVKDLGLSASSQEALMQQKKDSARPSLDEERAVAVL